MADATPSYLCQCLIIIRPVLPAQTRHTENKFSDHFGRVKRKAISFPIVLKSHNHDAVRLRSLQPRRHAALGFNLPAKKGPDKSQIQDDLQSLSDVDGTDIDPNLENGTILVDNGQGRCVASSGKAVCSGISG